MARTLCPTCRSAGFTLIELIAVIIILGVLAAIITPRYIGFVEQARTTAAKGAVAEGTARFSGAFQKYIVDNRVKPTALSDLSGAAYMNLDGASRVNVGDYDVSYSLAGSTLTLNAYAKSGQTSLASASTLWP